LDGVLVQDNFDKINLGINRVNQNGYGPYTVVVSPPSTNTAIQNGALLLAKTAEIEVLALDMSDNVPSPGTGLVNFDWFKPKLIIESGNYDLNGATWTPGKLLAGPPAEGRSSYFDIEGQTSPVLGLDTDVTSGFYVDAVATGNPKVWIKANVDYEPGFRSQVTGIFFDGNITCGTSLQFEGCWFFGTVEAGAGGFGNIFRECRFDSPVGVTSQSGASYINCLFSTGTVGSFAGGVAGTSADNFYFNNCTMLGGNLFRFNSMSPTVYINNCRINGDGIFIPPAPVNWDPDGKFLVRDTEFFDTGVTDWWDGYSISGPVANEFVRCEGVATNQQTDAARIVYCVDRTNTLMTHK
jgi:hypothetical protein